VRLAEVALGAGAHGLVCSPHEVAALRDRFGPVDRGGPLIVVPGVRLERVAGDDQRRTLTPREALEAGADILVVGRPITRAPDPADAARALRASLRR
jgi:orotidine-5'-phosphate decarboxylase